MPLLFSYGTLQDAAVQLATFGRLLDGSSDALPGYEPARVPITLPEVLATGRTHYENVVVSNTSGSSVAGHVYEITEAELDAADRYEEPACYVRRAVTLASGKKAWVYVAATTGNTP